MTVPVAIPVSLAERPADLHERRSGLLEHHLFIELARLLRFPRELPALLFFFGGSHRNVVVPLADAGGVLWIDVKRVLVGIQIDALALGVNLVLAVAAVPLRDGGVLVHVLEDLPPSHAR